MHIPNHHFANSIPPTNYATSPISPYAPTLPPPNFLPHFQEHSLPNTASAALPIPADWSWSGLGMTTPTHLQSQAQAPEWSVVAVKGASPGDTNSTQSPSITTKKRAFTPEDTDSNSPNRPTMQDVSNAKKRQVPSPIAAAPTVSKRPPFPFAVPRAFNRANQSAAHTQTMSSTLNPFATEFVFRPQQSAPKFGSIAKEFSPVRLQESSRSLFNVFAPEFNPSKSGSNIFRSSGFSMGKGTLFPKPENQAQQSMFVKPSPTKKVIPIVKPIDEEFDDEVSGDEESDGNVMKEAVNEVPSSSEPINDDGRLSSHQSSQNPFEEESDDENDAEDEADYEITEELSTLEPMSDDEPGGINQRKQSSDNIANDVSTPESPRSNNNAASGRLFYNDLDSSSEEISDYELGRVDGFKRHRSITPRPRHVNSEPPMRTVSLELNAAEFNGYPAFWEEHLLKSEQKTKRDRLLNSRASVARNLTNEFIDDGSDEHSDKENRVLRDPDNEASDQSEESVLESMRGKMSRMHLYARQNLAPRERMNISIQLQRLLEGLEAVQLGLENLSDVVKEEKGNDPGNDADDEYNETSIKNSSVLDLEGVKVAVVEALRQEKDLFATSPVVDRTAEVRDLKSTIDGLKSKLLDAKDNFDREERRRTEAERLNEQLSRDLTQFEQNLDLKVEQIKTFESEMIELQKNRDQAKAGWDEEKRTREKLDEVITGIRSSVGQLTDKNSKLSQEISTLRSLITSQKDEISNLREEISKARGENGKLVCERSKLERDIEDERNRFANLQSELMETGKAVAEQETRWREELAAEKLRVQGLERNLADEERRVKKMEEECERLTKIAEERGRLKAIVEASVAREQSLQTAKEVLERRVYTAEARWNASQEERTRLEKERSIQFGKEKESLNGEILSLRALVKSLREEMMQRHINSEREKMKITAQSEKIDSLGRELRQANQVSVEREKAIESSSRDLKENQSQIASLRKEIASLRDGIEKKDTQLESLREAATAARSSIAEKDKYILELEFIIASTPSPTKISRDDGVYSRLQKREKELLRLRELMGALLRDNEDLLDHQTETLAPEQQKKYNAMKNILRAERERKKALERELARVLAKNSSVSEDLGQMPGSRVTEGVFDTPASAVGGLDTPVSLNDTPGSSRGFDATVDTPLKGKRVLIQ